MVAMTTDYYRRLQMPRQKKPTSVVSLRLPKDLAKAIQKAAEKDRRSLNSMMIVLLERGLQDRLPASAELPDSTSGDSSPPVSLVVSSRKAGSAR
jgi:hypothetical protein